MTHDRISHIGQEAEFGFLRERELASRWRISQRTLQRWRTEGSGPAHVLIGGSVRYRMADVLAFEEGHRLGGNGS
ncbi:hypothetical protein DDZ14_14975 [Maritimibacter sp. 55A14]|uniref:helix-turn-helix transcriptional regulator n=1 Tax=Maritimibacter sp. 55A14 TaxID=2174844 RepID=UPI000D61F7D5|nr:helix-turn-helix domain-containing protein [Maritimibacter sp. 55A14]PWE30588.1 hypothetical protein DDZ14_14975 [Maritimibacter sp. 55A14]